MKLEVKPLLHGFMVIWGTNSKAARYTVSLYIKNSSKKTLIDTFEVGREKGYCSFTNLALLSSEGKKTHYFVEVKAEDREGKTIETASHLCLIDYLHNNAHYGLMLKKESE